MERPRILFACVGNRCRSQMAEALCRSLAGDNVDCKSGGSAPAQSVAPHSVEVLRERGVALVGARPKAIDEPFARRANIIVTMGCGADSFGSSTSSSAAPAASGGEDACPAFAGKRIVDWGLEDPIGGPLETYRRVRDEIEKRLVHLLKVENIL
ncbi:MAG: arsenate reductase ArsC [Euryarchaeota archaeon]|nr:arsenate reductase ArsC [Euryarchaeota archaeon]